jgi:hypothetical protein
MQRREFLGHVVRTAVAGGAVLVTRRGWATATETAGSAIAGSARRASVVDFGADPTGVKDATAAVQRAIASLARRNARLVFPAGKYTFAASDAVLMEFHGYEGLEIFGNGAELSFSGATRPMLINGCKDLEVHDIIVDWARPPFSQGTIKSISDRTITVAVDPAYPVDGSERVQTIAALTSRRGATCRVAIRCCWRQLSSTQHRARRSLSKVAATLPWTHCALSPTREAGGSYPPVVAAWS